MRRLAWLAIVANAACLPALETRRCNGDDDCAGLTCVLGECRPRMIDTDAGPRDADPPNQDANEPDAGEPIDSSDTGRDARVFPDAELDAGFADSGTITPALPWVVTAWENTANSARIDVIAVVNGPDGRVTIGFQFDQELRFDNRIFNNDAVDSLIAQLDKTGAILWTAHFTGVEEQRIQALAALPNGDVIAAGGLVGSDATINGRPIGASGGNSNLVLVRFDPMGRILASTTFGSSGEDEVFSLAADPLDPYVYAGGSIGDDFSEGSCNFSLTGNPPSGTTDGFVAAFDSQTLACVWAHPFGSQGNEVVLDVAYDPLSAVIAAVGTYEGVFELADFTAARRIVVPYRSGSDEESFVALFSAESGLGVRALDVGGAGDQVLRTAAFDPSGSLYASGSFVDSPQLLLRDATRMIGFSPPTVVLGLKLSPMLIDEAVLRALNVTGQSGPIELQNIFWAGGVPAAWGDLDQGATLTLPGVFLDPSTDEALLLYFDPVTGAAERSIVLGSNGDDGGFGAAYDPDGSLILGGMFGGALTFPGAATVSPSSTGRDGFVTRFQP